MLFVQNVLSLYCKQKGNSSRITFKKIDIMVYSDVFQKISSFACTVSISCNHGERKDFYNFNFSRIDRLDLFCESIIKNLYFVNLVLDASLSNFCSSNYHMLASIVDGYETIINRLSVFLNELNEKHCSVFDDDIVKTSNFADFVLTFHISDVKFK